MRSKVQEDFGGAEVGDSTSFRNLIFLLNDVDFAALSKSGQQVSLL